MRRHGKSFAEVPRSAVFRDDLTLLRRRIGVFPEGYGFRHEDMKKPAAPVALTGAAGSVSALMSAVFSAGRDEAIHGQPCQAAAGAKSFPVDHKRHRLNSYVRSEE